MRSVLAAAAPVVVIAAATQTAWCQSFTNEWVVDGPSGETGAVNAILRAGSSTYIGGRFDYVGPNTGGAAQFSTTSPFALVNGLPHFEGTVSAIAVDPNGGWWVGGTFTRVGTLTVTNLCHINANFSISTGFAPSVDGPVFALAADANHVYVGGSFTTVAGQSRSNFAQLTSNVTTPTLGSLTANADADVRALLLDGAGMVYLGGNFTVVNGTNVHERVAQVSISTGLTAWMRGTGNGADATVYALANNANGGAVFIGGAFLNFAGNTRHRICKVNATGAGALSNWSMGTNGIVRALAVDVGAAMMYMGGDFTTVTGSSRPHLAKVNQVNPGTLQPWNPGALNGTLPVTSLLIFNNWLYVGGQFTQLAGVSGFRGLGRVAYNGNQSVANGNADTTWVPLATGSVDAIAANSAGNTTDMYVGGTFHSIGGIGRINVARLIFNATANVWQADTNWTVDVGTTNSGQAVHALASVDTTLHVGGQFSQVVQGGTTSSRSNLCALAFSNGTLQSWNPSTDGPVYAILPAGSGQFYLGGRFSNVNSQSRANVARVSGSTGGTVDSWNPGTADASGSGANVQVFVLANAGGGSVLIGGDFAKVGGASHVALALVDSSGNTQSWDAGIYSGSTVAVRAIAQSPGGSTFFVGGLFSQVNTGLGSQASRNNIAELQYSNGAVTSWIAGANGSSPGVNNPVHALATLISTNGVYVGGAFEQVAGSTARLHIAKFDATSGALSTSWVPVCGVAGGTDMVNAITVDASAVDIGGSFKVVSSTGTPTTPTTSIRSVVQVGGP